MRVLLKNKRIEMQPESRYHTAESTQGADCPCLHELYDLKTGNTLRKEFAARTAIPLAEMSHSCASLMRRFDYDRC